MSSIAIDSRPIFIRFFSHTFPLPLLSSSFHTILKHLRNLWSTIEVGDDPPLWNSRIVRFRRCLSVSWSKGIIIAMAFLFFFCSPSLSSSLSFFFSLIAHKASHFTRSIEPDRLCNFIIAHRPPLQPASLRRLSLRTLFLEIRHDQLAKRFPDCVYIQSFVLFILRV